MHFEEDYTYHVYNRSNETVFYKQENYYFFLEKLHKYVLPYSDILAWCLMPNHFHLLLSAKPEAAKFINEKHRIHTQVLSKNIGTLLSSYSQAINKQENRRGALFAHKTIAKSLNFAGNQYAAVCFNYIHQNPCQIGLVRKPEDWEFSSYKDYISNRNNSLINIYLAKEIVNFDKENFAEWSEAIADEKLLKGIW